MLATYYKGRISFNELKYMPLSEIAFLYKHALDKSEQAETDEKEKERQMADTLETELEDIM